MAWIDNGVVRATPVPPSFDKAALVKACFDSGAAVNPNSSPGCSPVLRLFLYQSGIAHGVVREVANDGDPNSHLGGNALDVTDPLSGPVSALVRTFPYLFSCAAYVNPADAKQNVFVLDGSVVTALEFGGLTSQFLADCTDHIHIASSRGRLHAGLHSELTSSKLPTKSQVTASYLPAIPVGKASVVDPTRPRLNFW